jgi:glycosyltransferase involved in cell wall biosynthesis
MLRVLMVAARFLPDVGGIETHIYEVTRRMAKRGDLDLTVLATDRSGTLSVREESEGFTVLRCRSYPRKRDYYIAPSIYRLIQHGDYDLVHCQGIHTAVPVLAMMAAKRRRIPYVVTFHTGGHSSGIRHRLRNLQWCALSPLLHDAAGLVAVSRFEQRLFEKACRIKASHIRIIQNGGDLPTDAVKTQPVRGRIVSSGRLERYKGHQRLIEALPVVQLSVPHATLHILGSGRYEINLRSLIATLGLQKSVVIDSIAPGDRDRMAKALGEASVFAALSEYEAHPVAVMEALTLGIPTVGLDVAGVADLVEDGLVWGVPRDATPATLAGILVAALNRGLASDSVPLPTWDTAATDLAHVYFEATGAGLDSHRSYDL